MDTVKEKVQSNLFIVYAIFVISLLYYALLSAKTWTWMFASGDSGDWLAASTIWMVPQPAGSPLYISLGHSLNTIVSSPELAAAMTFFLSVIPAAITVITVYQIIRELGLEVKFALIGSGVLLACGVFLSQATVLEEYSIATMFITLAFYAHLRKNYKMTALMLGLGTAVHVIVGVITVVWIVANWREWKFSWKPMAGIYFVVGLLPYSLILILMALDTPRFIAGGLSLQSLNAYLGSAGTIGRISLVETPGRLLEASWIILLSFGVALIPLVKGLQRPWHRFSVPAIVLIGICTWLYITNTDATTWTFLTFSLPIACVAIAYGLTRLPRWTLWTGIGCVIILISLNTTWLNADVLTRQNPRATTYGNALVALPDGATVVISRGGPYGLGAMYVMARGKELTPIFLQDEEGWDNRGYQDYLTWVENSKGLPGGNWIEQIDHSIIEGKLIFATYNVQPDEWKEEIRTRYELVPFNSHFWQITGSR